MPDPYGYDPLGCQPPQLSYMAGMADADKRLKAGQKQSYCTRCERWRWKDRLCGEATVEEVDYGL